ncbi:hypothetical protein KA005_01630, partial [bacterium]|nr:hypothetical protein [bacterium]
MTEQPVSKETIDDLGATPLVVIARRIAQLEAALTLIGDLAYDRDGHTGDAEKLGELIDEIHGY